MIDTGAYSWMAGQKVFNSWPGYRWSTPETPSPGCHSEGRLSVKMPMAQLGSGPPNGTVVAGLGVVGSPIRDWLEEVHCPIPSLGYKW